jgi:hypothetical protein
LRIAPLDLVQPGLALRLGQVADQVPDLGAGQADQLQRRQRPLRQAAPQALLPIDDRVAPPPDLADAPDQQRRVGDDRHLPSPSVLEWPPALPASRRPGVCMAEIFKRQAHQ